MYDVKMNSIKMAIVMTNEILWKKKCHSLNQNKEMTVCYLYIKLIKVKILKKYEMKNGIVYIYCKWWSGFKIAVGLKIA